MTTPDTPHAEWAGRGPLGIPAQWFWPGLVVALIGMSLTMCAVTIVAATTDKSFAVEPDYYAKALRWDDTAAQRKLNEQLAWKVQIIVEPNQNGASTLRASVADNTGTPVDGARVNVLAFPHARASQIQRLELQERLAGSYSSSVDINRAGIWEFRVTVERDSERFTSESERIIETTDGN